MSDQYFVFQSPRAQQDAASESGTWEGVDAKWQHGTQRTEDGAWHGEKTQFRKIAQRSQAQRRMPRRMAR